MISASKCRPLNSAGRFRIMHPQAYQTACPPLQHILQHCLGENNLHQSVQCEYVELNGEPQTIADEAALPRNVGTYDGWNLVTTVSGEIRDPQRSLPIALMFGVGAVGVVYIAMNAALQFVMSA